MNPTLVQITLFNAILNPYPGPRPKNPPKLYNMKNTFETIVNSRELPNKLVAVKSTFVDHIRIDKVYACLPGGRVCRERAHGTQTVGSSGGYADFERRAVQPQLRRVQR